MIIFNLIFLKMYLMTKILKGKSRKVSWWKLLESTPVESRVQGKSGKPGKVDVWKVFTGTVSFKS